MRSIKIYSAQWYPGQETLTDVIEAARERLEGKDISIELVDVDEDVAAAEENKIICLPTAVLSKEDVGERRRITGAIGLVELLGLAGVRTRARKTK